MIIVGRVHTCGCCVNGLQLSAETSLDPFDEDFPENFVKATAEVACLTALQRILKHPQGLTNLCDWIEQQELSFIAESN